MGGLLLTHWEAQAKPHNLRKTMKWEERRKGKVGGERGEGEREEGSMLRAEPVPVGLDFDDVSKARLTN